jgi:hypothetical protein
MSNNNDNKESLLSIILKDIAEHFKNVAVIEIVAIVIALIISAIVAFSK